MGRRPIGSKPMTPAERQQRRRQGIRSSAMTRGERTDLGVLIRKHEKLMKTTAKQRALELRADFERQISHIFEYDEDETWKAAYAAAEQAVEDAKAVIAQRCRELSIPPEFAPNINMTWYGRGRTALNERRIELRRVAWTKIDAMEAAAKTKIERASVEAQTALIADGPTSEAAHAFLEQIPTAETLMPMLVIEQIKTLVGKD